MTTQNPVASWATVRDDDADAYQILDPTEQIIASVPIGTSKQNINRQQHVRDLVVAAPILFNSAQQVLDELGEAEPNLEACRAVLNRALSAARGQL